MDKKISFLILSLFISSFSYAIEPVNSIIGDKGYYKMLGVYPGKLTPEKERILYHLNYVLSYLTSAQVSHLTPELQKSRQQMLTLLKEYIEKGEFPSNYDHPGKRMPCFIDEKGNICAVGYLVAETKGYSTAEKINAEFKYSYIYDMQSEQLNQWLEESGLTLDECQMIQPSYGYSSNDDRYRATTEYIAASSILGGLNLSFTAVNTVQLINREKEVLAPVLGMITGLGQTVVGFSALGEPRFENSDSDKKILTAFNIALGTTTVITSFLNLLDKPKENQKSSSGLSLTSIPINKDKNAYGLKYSIQF